MVCAMVQINKKKNRNRHNIKFDTVLASNDVLFSTYIGFYAKKIVVDTNTIYTTTARKGSLTQNPTVNHLRSRIEVLIRNNRFLSNHKLDKLKNAYIRWLLPILAYYGLYEFLKAILFIITKQENPLFGFADEVANLCLTLKKSKHMFKRLIYVLKKKTIYHKL